MYNILIVMYISTATRFYENRRLAGCNEATRSLKVALSIRQPLLLCLLLDSREIGFALANISNFRVAGEK